MYGISVSLKQHTLYHTALMKKELIVRLVSGEKITDFVLKQALIDVGFYCLLFTAAFVVLSQVTNATFHFGLSLLCISIFLILNSLAYTWLLFTNYKKDIGTYNSAKGLINVSYVYKTITIFLTVLIMSGSITLIVEGVNCYKQKDFFLEHKSKFYVMLAPSDLDTADMLTNKMYSDAIKRNKVCTLVEVPTLQGLDGNYVYADRGAVSYLKAQIPELKAEAMEEKAYILKPGDYSRSGNQLDEAKAILQAYCGEGLTMQTISYDSDIEIVAQSGEGGLVSMLKQNPVVILNNTKSESIDCYFWAASMVDMTEKTWNTFLKEHKLEDEIAYRTNVYENYIHHWKLLQRGMILGIVLLTIMLIMESVIIHTTLYYEYRLNAMELSLQKVLGYSLFERHRKIADITIITGCIGLMAAIIVSLLCKLGNIVPLIIAGGSLIILEILFIARYVHRLEKISVQRILKGGVL